MKNLCLTDPAFLAPASSVTPASFSNLLRWWDASNLAYSNGTNIDNSTHKFTDRSSNADHAIQASGGLQPIFNTGVQNGLGGVNFDGIDDELSFTAISSATALSIIAVVKNTAIAQGTLGIMKNSGGTGDFRLDLGVSLEVKYRLTDNGNDTSGLCNQFTATSSQTMVTAVCADNGASNNADFYEGATSRGTFTVSTFSLSLDRIAAAVGTTFSGYIFELIVYGAKRNSTEIASLYNNYLKTKWGL